MFMYKLFETTILFGISYLSYLRLRKIREQREQYLKGDRWIPRISGVPKEDRKLAYEHDIFMAKSSIVLSSLIGAVDLVDLLSQLLS